MRCTTSTQKIMRKQIVEHVEKRAKENNFTDFVKIMVDGTLTSEVREIAKKIYPVIYADIRKSKVLSLPEAHKVQTSTAA